MRFRQLHARCFGPIRDRLLDLDTDAVIVFGHNESGKSSFRAAVETVLYGFDPATRDAHPLHRWDGGSGGDMCLEAELQLDNGEIVRVERLLQSSGKLRTAGAGEEFSGRRLPNRALPATAGLPREIYRAIYSLELEQLAALERRVQEHVDDLLLPEVSGLELRPLSELRRELREETQRLWRPDRRGQPVARQLRRQLADARTRLDEAARGEQKLRAASRQYQALGVELAQLRERKRALERTRDDAPYLRQLRDLFQRRRQLGPPVDLTPLGDMPLVAPEALARELEDLEASRRAPIERLERPAELPHSDATALLERAAEIESLLTAGVRQDALRERAGELMRRADALCAEAGRELERTLARGAGADELETAGALPLDALRAAQAEWARAWEARATEATASTAAPPSVLAAAALGGGLFLAGFLLDAGGLAPVGAILLVGALFALVWRSSHPAAPPPPPVRPEALDESLRELPIAPGLLETPAELQRLLDTLERVHRRLADASALDGERWRLDEASAQAERQLTSACAAAGLETGGGYAACEERLRLALAAAREQLARARQDTVEREQARLEAERSAPLVARKRDHLGRIRQVLSASAGPQRDAVTGPQQRGGDPNEGRELADAFARVSAQLDEAAFLARQEEQLRADPRFESLAADPRLRAESSPEAAEWTRERGEKREAELEDCETQLARLGERRGELRELLRRDPGSQRARAADAVLGVEERLAASERERDRLALLESILAHAETDYRDAHQPDVLRRAGSYLRRITDGRYARIDYDLKAGGLFVTPSGRAEPVRVADPISRGTLDQIFLCLRLGLLDHMDEEREKLPLILDDALLRMDDTRRPEAYRLLADLSGRRQTFLLTCHAAIAREAEEVLKVARIDLSA